MLLKSDAKTNSSWWYNYLPVPEATVHNEWWCMIPDQIPFTPAAMPKGEERWGQQCIPNHSKSQTISRPYWWVLLPCEASSIVLSFSFCSLFLFVQFLFRWRFPLKERRRQDTTRIIRLLSIMSLLLTRSLHNGNDNAKCNCFVTFESEISSFQHCLLLFSFNDSCDCHVWMCYLIPCRNWLRAKSKTTTIKEPNNQLGGMVDVMRLLFVLISENLMEKMKINISILQREVFSLGFKCDFCSNDLWRRERNGQLWRGDLRRRHPWWI